MKNFLGIYMGHMNPASERPDNATMARGIAAWHKWMADNAASIVTAGGPLGKVLDGDIIEIIVDRNNLEGSLNLIGSDGYRFGAEVGKKVLMSRPLRADLHADKDLPEDSRLWAALQDIGGGAWGGCVYETEKILKVLEAGKRAMGLV